MKNLCLFLMFCIGLTSCSEDSSFESFSGNNSSSSGQSGSTASIITYKGFIYTLDNNILKTLSLADPANPVEVSSIQLGSGIETIFAYEDHLYLGTRNGILLYDISDGAKPEYSGTSFHWPAEDPVVVQGDFAYSTSRWGTEANGNGNLQVINIANKDFPNTIQTINQEYPCGLGIASDVLYVCNAGHGINVFKIDQSGRANFLQNIQTDALYDCIIAQDLMICQGKSGIYLFNIKNKENPVFIQKVAN